MRGPLNEDELLERQRTVAEYHLIWEDDEDDSPALRDQVLARRTELRRTYLDLLPSVPVSRCPFGGDVLQRAIDVVDLDGLYWEAERPTRPPVEEAPTSFVGLVGALRLGEPIALAPFLAKPGPEVPYVRPDVLGRPGVGAVVSTLAVGPHTGYPIAYFFDPAHGPVPDDLRMNEWGSERFRVRDGSGTWRWGTELDDESTYDYDLRPWLERGDLQWIAPGDADLVLRQGAQDCPYLDLPGHRAVTRVEEGEVWWPEDVAGRTPG